MDTPGVFMRTAGRDLFSYQDGYERMSIPDLTMLLKQARETSQSLEAELLKRQVPVDHTRSNVVTECSHKLQKTARNLKVLGRLNDRETTLVAAAIEILETKQTNRESKIYQTFLDDIINFCGHAVALLCAASLGKQKLVSLNAEDRIQLVEYIKTNQSILKFTTLEEVVEKYQLSDRNGGITLEALEASATIADWRRINCTWHKTFRS
ncbi:hypothetical protein LTR70_007437 [Exophiala xenobiotica]|uniref:Uncharacterized protein n=1 Tax=Lithohypha guttulata TaxID=1690604 RepID=A0ABR0K4D5_9EURO|nr:hypothetical protein LTR24_006977 [Lithohypha guttulata]KAK5313794.1 hypothetical protein LTR70_007437 [Exophiala xenobiotica]